MLSIHFIDSTRFIASSLSNLVNRLSEEIHRIKRKFINDDKKCGTCRIKYRYCNCFLEQINFEDNLIEYICLVTKIIITSLMKNYRNGF